MTVCNTSPLMPEPELCPALTCLALLNGFLLFHLLLTY